MRKKAHFFRGEIIVEPPLNESIYKFENNVLDENNLFNGVASNITYSTGKLGQGAVFNGINSKIENMPLIIYDSFSIYGWLKTTNTGNKSIFSQRSSTSGGAIVLLGMDNNKFYTRLRNSLSGNITTLQSSTNINNGSWFFVGMTFDISTMEQKTYVNGIAEASTIYGGGSFIALDPNISKPVLGVGEPSLNFGWWDGDMDEFNFTQTTKTPSEMLAIYNSY